jgi:hypothetical protein
VPRVNVSAPLRAGRGGEWKIPTGKPTPSDLQGQAGTTIGTAPVPDSVFESFAGPHVGRPGTWMAEPLLDCCLVGHRELAPPGAGIAQISRKAVMAGSAFGCMAGRAAAAPTGALSVAEPTCPPPRRRGGLRRLGGRLLGPPFTGAAGVVEMRPRVDGKAALTPTTTAVAHKAAHEEKNGSPSQPPK